MHQHRSNKAKKPCKVCKRIRYFAMVLGAIVVSKLLVPDLQLPAGIDYSRLVGDIAIGVFVAVVIWKVWEYRREQKQAAQQAKEEPWRLAIREVAARRTQR